MSELVGHPGRVLRISSTIDVAVLTRIVLGHVLGLRYIDLDKTQPESWRCEGWLEELGVDHAVRSTVLPDARLARHAPIAAAGTWLEEFARRPPIQELVSPVTDALRLYIAEMATTWREGFDDGGKFRLVDHRGAVLYGRISANTIEVHDVERWGHPNAPAKSNRTRSGEALKSLRQLFGNPGQITRKDLSCPDPAGRSVNSGEWPAHFPANCPPASLPDATGDVYYLIPSSGTSFQSTAEIRTSTTSWSCPCEQAALSVWRSLEAVLRLRESSTKLRTHHVARARLEPQHGKLARTGPSKDHMSLWLRREQLSQASSLFEILHEHDQEHSPG